MVEVCVHGNSTIKTAEANGVPLKTFENWITSFNKDPHCFDFDNSSSINDFYLISSFNNNFPYDDMSNEELKIQLIKKDIEIQRLKKGYSVEGGGTEQKVFVSLSKKNTIIIKKRLILLLKLVDFKDYLEYHPNCSIV